MGAGFCQDFFAKQGDGGAADRGTVPLPFREVRTCRCDSQDKGTVRDHWKSPSKDLRVFL